LIVRSGLCSPPLMSPSGQNRPLVSGRRRGVHAEASGSSDSGGEAPLLQIVGPKGQAAASRAAGAASTPQSTRRPTQAMHLLGGAQAHLETEIAYAYQELIKVAEHRMVVLESRSTSGGRCDMTDEAGTRLMVAVARRRVPVNPADLAVSPSDGLRCGRAQ
jgi:hypothetical protein